MIKILVEKVSNIVKDAFDQNDPVTIGNESTVSSNKIIVGATLANADLFAVDKIPSGFKPNKFLYDGTNFSVNPNFTEPVFKDPGAPQDITEIELDTEDFLAHLTDAAILNVSDWMKEKPVVSVIMSRPSLLSDKGRIKRMKKFINHDKNDADSVLTQATGDELVALLNALQEILH